jgi:predicted RNA-binding Zn-ribbon protein involved in translation (DUF1610 family)
MNGDDDNIIDNRKDGFVCILCGGTEIRRRRTCRRKIRECQ